MTDTYDILGLNTHNLVVKSEQDRVFEGYVTVEAIDTQGEITVRDELLKTMDIWLKRGGPMSYSHSNQIVGKGLEYWKEDYELPDGRVAPAIKIKGKVYADTKLDDIVWGKMKEGTIKGLSYGGATRSGKEAQVQNDGSIAYLLKDLEVYEVALCELPVNNFALITNVNTIAKSLNPKLLKEKTIDRGSGSVCFTCDTVKCQVEKAESFISSSEHTDFVSNMSETVTEVQKTEEKPSVSELTDLVTTTVKAVLYDLRKEEAKEDEEDKEDEKMEKAVKKGDGEDKEDEETEDTEKGYVKVDDFNKLVKAMTDFTKMTADNFEAIKKDTFKVTETGPGENKSNNELEVMPDEDSEQATMEPTDDNSNDEVHIAKAIRPTSTQTKPISGETFMENPVLEDAKKGVPMIKILEKVRTHQYMGMEGSR